jgi:serine/threonine protein kinase
MAQTTKQMFGKYQILGRIATGGMAEILKARTESFEGFQRTFAIKRVLAHLSQNKEYIAMLVDEAKIAGLLSHANIVQILDLGQIDNTWFIAMEYVDGADLGRIIKKTHEKGVLIPVPHAVYIVMELLKGLEYAHQREVVKDGQVLSLNIVHRDISPPNILLSVQGGVKLTDFGIAVANNKVLNTDMGIVKGRYDYMSPEQANAALDLDGRSDLFSVGVVLYEMLAGQHPFRTRTELGTLDRIRLGQYQPLQVLNPEVPKELGRIVDQTLRVDRDERYGSAKVFREVLDGFFHDSGFLFTHSTLASYMGSLLAESADVESPMQPDPEKPKSASKSDFESDFPDPDEWDEELDTVVGRSVDLGEPLLLDEDLSQQETVIRQGHLPKPPPEPGAVAADVVPQLKAKPLPAHQATPRPASPRQRTQVTPAAKVAQPPKTVAGLWPIAAMVTFLLGLFFGSALGVVAASAMAWY